MTVLGFEDVVEADLSAMAKAAADWTEMARRYRLVQHRLENEVLSVTGNQGLWLGYTALTAHRHVGHTRQQTLDAQTEAAAVASIIGDAHDDFGSAQQKLRRTVADAQADGMKVTGTGAVVFDVTTLDEGGRSAYRHEPDYRRERDRAAAAWAQKIRTYLEEATAADSRAARGLRRAAKVGDLVNEFNGRAVGGGDEADGRRAASLARKLKDGRTLGPEELAELDNLMKAGSGNPVYGRTLLGALGAEGTLLLADELDVRINDRSGRLKGEYGGLRANLADTVAGATRDTGSTFYREFREGLREAGVRNIDDRHLGGGPAPVHGYQALVTLLRNGTAGYGAQFLDDLGTDVLAADRRGNHWRVHQFNGPRPDLVHDPVDGVLGLMGRSPEAATRFLDPRAPGAEDRLRYLLRERDWPTSCTTALVGPPIQDRGTHQAGLAAALEAAATGDVPGGGSHRGGPHTPAQARVMQGVVDALDADGRGAEVHEDLRVPLANALSDYVADTHPVLGQHHAGAHRTGAWEQDGEGHLGGSADHLVRVMRGASEEPEAYATLYNAERAEAAVALAAVPPDPQAGPAERQGPARNIGTALGAFDAIRSDIVLDEKDDRMEWAEKAGGFASSVSGTVTGFVPEVGGVAGAFVDAGISGWVEDVRKDAQDAGNTANSRAHFASLTESQEMAGAWGRANHLNEDETELISTELGTGHTSGNTNALIALGRNVQQ
ncbi:hypothetical protein ACFVYP_26030 [Kitasatospora sp. NPDC058201]|uniref:hypothetical protein n=1 Tax=Kitasatospora sp. NPDC058201 TaxID=3346379 RepID=UPI0036DAA753